MSCALQNNVNVSRTLLNKANMSMLINDANNDNKTMLNNADISRTLLNKANKSMLINDANNDNKTMLNNADISRTLLNNANMSRHLLNSNNDNNIMLNNADMSRPLVNNANNDNETMLKRLLPSVNQKSTTRGGLGGVSSPVIFSIDGEGMRLDKFWGHSSQSEDSSRR